MIYFNQKEIKIMIVVTISMSDFKSDGFHRPNSLESELELSMIRFRTPNRLTFVRIKHSWTTSNR